MKMNESRAGSPLGRLRVALASRLIYLVFAIITLYAVSYKPLMHDRWQKMANRTLLKLTEIVPAEVEQIDIEKVFPPEIKFKPLHGGDASTIERKDVYACEDVFALDADYAQRLNRMIKDEKRAEQIAHLTGNSQTLEVVKLSKQRLLADLNDWEKVRPGILEKCSKEISGETSLSEKRKGLMHISKGVEVLGYNPQKGNEMLEFVARYVYNYNNQGYPLTAKLLKKQDRLKEGETGVALVNPDNPAEAIYRDNFI